MHPLTANMMENTTTKYYLREAEKSRMLCRRTLLLKSEIMKRYVKNRRINQIQSSRMKEQKKRLEIMRMNEQEYSRLFPLFSSID